MSLVALLHNCLAWTDSKRSTQGILMSEYMIWGTYVSSFSFGGMELYRKFLGLTSFGNEDVLWTINKQQLKIFRYYFGLLYIGQSKPRDKWSFGCSLVIISVSPEYMGHLCVFCEYGHKSCRCLRSRDRACFQSFLWNSPTIRKE